MCVVEADLMSLNRGIAANLAKAFYVKLRVKDTRKFCHIVFLVLSTKNIYPWRDYCGESL